MLRPTRCLLLKRFLVTTSKMYNKLFILIVLTQIVAIATRHQGSEIMSIEDMINDYADDRNAMATVTEKDPDYVYDDCYEDIETNVLNFKSMNVLFFGPAASFLRLDGETILYILINVHKHMIPVSRIILAWDLLTDGKTSAFLQGRELMAFGPLLNYVPEEDLYYVNFGDPTVLNFFASQDINLRNRKYGILASVYKRYFGNDWYQNSTYINGLGYIICGFPPSDLSRIPPHVLANVNTDVLSKLKKCGIQHVQTLYNIAIHPDAFNVPYKWSSHDIARLDYLFTYIDDQDISSIQLEAVRSITPAVINAMNISKLNSFTKQQVLQMKSKTRRLYIMRMQTPTSSQWDALQERAGSWILYPIRTLILVTLVIQLIANYVCMYY